MAWPAAGYGVTAGRQRCLAACTARLARRDLGLDLERRMGGKDE